MLPYSSVCLCFDQEEEMRKAFDNIRIFVLLLMMKQPLWWFEEDLKINSLLSFELLPQSQTDIVAEKMESKIGNLLGETVIGDWRELYLASQIENCNYMPLLSHTFST